VIALFHPTFLCLSCSDIFALGLRGLGPLTKRAAPSCDGWWLAGILSPLMGAIADHSGNVDRIYILFCFAFICWYAVWSIKNRRRYGSI